MTDKHTLPYVVAGLSILLLTYAFYLLYRPESLVVALTVGNVFELAHDRSFVGSGSLPSFLHTLAFSFLTGACVSLTRTNVLIIGVLWFLTNIVYEVFSASYLAAETGFLFNGNPGDAAFSLLGMVAYMGSSFWVMQQEKKYQSKLRRIYS